jgi:hypothetical protein
VKEGMSIPETLPHSIIYRYPQFVKGYVIFKNGEQMRADLNFNTIMSKIVFISSSSDTLAIANPDDIKTFIVGTDRYIFDKVYYRIVVATPSIMLACHQYTKPLEYRRDFGYFSRGFIGKFNPEIDNSFIYNMILSRETLFSITSDYFLGTDGHDFIAATKKNLIQIFPEKSSQIKKFIKVNKLNLKKGQDLEKLTKFVSSGME